MDDHPIQNASHVRACPRLRHCQYRRSSDMDADPRGAVLREALEDRARRCRAGLPRSAVSDQHRPILGRRQLEHDTEFARAIPVPNLQPAISSPGQNGGDRLAAIDLGMELRGREALHNVTVEPLGIDLCRTMLQPQLGSNRGGEEAGCEKNLTGIVRHEHPAR